MNGINITAEDIDRLLELFQQLDDLLKPALPPKDDNLWCEAKKAAKEELIKKLKERGSTFSERPGPYVPPRKATKAEQRRAQERVEKRIVEIAEKKYCEQDHTYSEAVDEAKKTTADVLKEIDHLLACVGESIQQLPQAKDTWLVGNFKEIRRLYDLIDKNNIKYNLQETIDVLQALRLKLERQQRLKAPVQEQVRPNKKNAKINYFIIVISIFIICIFEFLIYRIPISWLQNHPNSYGLQGGFVLLVPCFVAGCFKPRWRKWCWGGAALAIIVLILSLLGGPNENG